MIDLYFELNGQPMSALTMGAISFPAFSGLGSNVNKRSSMCLADSGPIPPGVYYIFDRKSGGMVGSLRDRFNGHDQWFSLYAIDEKIDDHTYCNKVMRGNFRLHPKGQFGINKGCITLENLADYQKLRVMLKNTSTKKIKEAGIAYGAVTVK